MHGTQHIKIRWSSWLVALFELLTAAVTSTYESIKNQHSLFYFPHSDICIYNLKIFRNFWTLFLIYVSRHTHLRTPGPYFITNVTVPVQYQGHKLGQHDTALSLKS
jgi:hypothetical protein